VESLKRLGIAATIRQVDEAQYLRRTKSFDFDIIGARFSMQITPGPELKNFFGSEAAGYEGSYNLSGIANPAVDALILAVAKAESRESLDTAGRALDRVLRAGHYWVPNWYKAAHTIAFWDKFGWPERKPDYDPGILDTWWYDKAKAARLASN
jgi:microcin C transport system substrate-binding protein